MTSAAVPVLSLVPEVIEAWLPKIVSRDYDPGFRPAGEKSAVDNDEEG